MSEPSFVTVNWTAVKRLMDAQGLTIEPLSSRVAISLATLKRWRDGHNARPAQVIKLANFFRVDIQTLCRPDAFAAGASHPMTGTVEWKPDGALDQLRLTPNGLSVVVCRMKHQHIANRLARGKYYPLVTVPAAQRNTLTEKLLRHSEVCSRIPSHPNVARNLSTNYGEAKTDWWVIDEWVGESLLSDLVDESPLDAASLPKILTGVTAGLLQLHAADIIFRELSPNRVLIRDATLEPVLTDFELAKLLDGSPSVSTAWKEDCYRAPEVESGVFDVRADYYSLARVAEYCVGGDVDTETDLQSLWKKDGMPKRVVDWLMAASSPIPEDRPGSTDSLLADLQRWKGKATP